MKTTTVTQKCNNCNGDLIFDASKKALVCQKCGNSIIIYNNITNIEKSFQNLLLNAPAWQKEASVYCCEQCGAKSVITKHDFSIVCDYCGAKNVNKTKEIPGLRPDTVCLFSLNPEEAQHKIKEWLSKRFFMPNSFKRMIKNRKLSGVYFPAFTFDARVSTKYNATGVSYKTFTMMVDGKQTTHNQVLRRYVDGVDEHVFDDVVVLANEEIDPKIIKKLQPFDTQHGQVYKQEYLAGFHVAQSSKEPMQCWEEAKGMISSIIRDKIISKYSGLRLEDLKMEVNITNIMYKYVLLPIFVGHTEYKGKRYELFLNGQNGKIYGKTPKSGWKVFRFFALSFMAVGAAIVLAMFL